MGLRYVSPVSAILRIFCSNTSRAISAGTPSSIQVRSISSSSTCQSSDSNGKETRRKTQRIPEISLLHPDMTVSVTTLEHALKIAKRRDLMLIKFGDIDPKTKRQTYSLVSRSSFLANTEKSERNDEKTSPYRSQKLITIQSKIGHNDLLVKCKQMQKLLIKKNIIKVIVVMDDDQSAGKVVLDTITEHLKEYAKKIDIGGNTVILYPPVENDMSQKHIVENKKKQNTTE